MKRFWVTSLALVLAFAGMGCGKAKQVAADKVTEAAIEHAAKSEGKDVNVKVDSSKGNFQMTQTTDGGKTSASYGEGTKVPADFPKDVPVIDGLALVMAQGTPEKGEFLISGTVPGKLDKAIAFYKEKTTAQGWKVDSNMSVPNQNETTIYKKDDRTLNVTISMDSDKVSLMLAVSK